MICKSTLLFLQVGPKLHETCTAFSESGCEADKKKKTKKKKKRKKKKRKKCKKGKICKKKKRSRKKREVKQQISSQKCKVCRLVKGSKRCRWVLRSKIKKAIKKKNCKTVGTKSNQIVKNRGSKLVGATSQKSETNINKLVQCKVCSMDKGSRVCKWYEKTKISTNLERFITICKTTIRNMKGKVQNTTITMHQNCIYTNENKKQQKGKPNTPIQCFQDYYGEKSKGGAASDERIVGGTPASNPMPWMVAIAISSKYKYSSKLTILQYTIELMSIQYL